MLVPDIQRPAIDEMCAGKLCIISRGKLKGRDTLELMFDDDTDAPFSLYLEIHQADRHITIENKPFAVVAWTRFGKIMEWKGKYRVVRKLPCLDAWGER